MLKEVKLHAMQITYRTMNGFEDIVEVIDELLATRTERDSLAAALAEANKDADAFYKWAREDAGDSCGGWQGLAKLCDEHESRVKDVK